MSAPIGDGGDRRNRFPGPGIAAIGKFDGSILHGNFVDDEGSIVSALVSPRPLISKEAFPELILLLKLIV